MRSPFFLGILLLTSTIAQAQLTNTKWAGKMNVPNETRVMLDFKKDSVVMFIVDEARVGEIMTYSIQDSIITMKKKSGHSPCSVDDVFKVTYTIKNDKLFISNLSDNCDARIQAWTNEPFVLIKE
jgi:hypothetical protein